MSRTFGPLLRYLRRTVGRADADGLTDGQLLDRFVGKHEEAAFETLIQRHGPLVWSVCRRLLQNTADAEDAFQATFLVLVRRPGSLKKKSSLSCWLYGIAYRIALKARAQAARRLSHEWAVATMALTPNSDDGGQQELYAVLDAELYRLPEKYRAPLILCYLQDKTNEQAARELGWPAGSMSMRLNQARELLRERLAHRRTALSTAALGTVLAESAAMAAVPPSVVEWTRAVAQALVTTGQATTAGVASASVTALTEGMVKTMFLAKLRVAALTLAACLVFTVSGLLASQAFTEPAVPPPAKPVAERPDDRSLSPQQFSRLHALIKPQDGESKYLDQMPWPKTVWDARQQAAAQGKPLFVFRTRYSPLGQC